jgi:ABC-type dipeptide/oligopeptide/nickel transport system permease subunit
MEPPTTLSRNVPGLGAEPSLGRGSGARLSDAWSSVRRVPLSALIGLVGVGFYLFLALFAQWVAPYGVAEVVGKVWEEPSSQFLLGTDNLGRDLLSRLIWGAQTTILIAAAATFLSFAMGTVLGFLAAVMLGWTDQILSRLNDLLMAIPTLIFALVVLSVLPSELYILILVMAVLDATRVFRLSRSVAADIAVMDFVEAARPQRRRLGLDHLSRDPAQRPVAATRRARPALRLRRAVPLLALLPRPRHPAAER